MPAQVQDLIHETSTSTGTGNLTVTAVNGKVRISDATHGFGTGDDGADNPVLYISNRSAAEWEVCPGYMSDANTLVRGTPIKSSNANAAVNFSAGIKDVTSAIPASKLVDTERTQTLSNKTHDGATLPVIYSDDGVGEGPVTNLLRNSASPAASDLIGGVAFQGKDSAANTETYAKILAEIIDATSTSEDGRINWQTVIAGALATRLQLGHGLYTPSVTGGDKGANTANIGTIYQSNVPVLTSIALQAFTASGTYTPTTGMKFCLVISTGGGGGGGGADCSDASAQAAGSGGSGAGTCIELFSAATIGASQTVTIGTGGTPGANTGTNGGNGGNTTFGALHTAGGGLGGTGVVTASDSYSLGVAGGTATGGLLNISGQRSPHAIGTGGIAYSSAGGGSFWGGGAPRVYSGATPGTRGIDADVFGAGGSGGAALNATGGAAGGAGKDGVVLVIEFI